MERREIGNEWLFGFFGLFGSFGWLNETNQMNQTDHAQARCGGAERGRTAASQFRSTSEPLTPNDDEQRQTTTPPS
jgi:hypothetical protein